MLQELLSSKEVIMNKLIKSLTIAVLAVVAVSCQWRPLEDPSDAIELKVVIELRAVNNITQNIYNKKIPIPPIESEMFRVIFYDHQTGKEITQAFLSEPTVNSEGKSCLGGTVNVSPGKYDMVCYNFDISDTFIRHEDKINTMQAYTRSISDAVKARYNNAKNANGGSTKAIDFDNDDILHCPEHVVVAREIGLEIKPHSGTIVIETEANTVVDTYYVQVHVDGLQYASSASAIISSMAPSNHIGLNERDTLKDCAIFFTLQPSTDDHITGSNKDVLCTLFNTFGKIYSIHSDLAITFNVVSIDGSIFDYVIDMDDIFETEDALKRHWLLIDKTIVIPAPIGPSGGGGFNPEITDWEEIHGGMIL